MALAIAATNTYSKSDAGISSHPINLPAGIASGDLLLVFAVFNGGPTVTDPSGWSLLASNGASGDAARIYAKIADGSEGATVTVTLSGNQRAHAASYRITGNRNGVTSSEIAVSTAVDANTATPDPPSLTPSWGSDENLWIAVDLCASSAFTFSSYPTNYSLGQLNAQSGNNNNANAVSVAARLLTATSEDPGSFTTVTARDRSTYTLAVRPLPATAVNADLAVTEADDSVSASSGLEIQASLSSTEAGDVPTAAGALQVAAASFITEGDDTSAATATLALSGSLAVTEGADVPSASGTVDIVGAAAIAEADDTLDGLGALAIEASLTVTEEDDTLSASALMPILYPRRGGDEEWARYERRQIEWEQQLRRIIDRSWQIANGEIDPVTLLPIPPPDYSTVVDELMRQALALDQERTAAFIAEQERMQEEEAIAVLLLVA